MIALPCLPNSTPGVAGQAGGLANAEASLDLTLFDSKAPPPKTPAFWDIVDANRAPEDADLADVLDALNNPAAVTLSQIATRARSIGIIAFADWLSDRKNSRAIPHRLENCDYTAVRNEDVKDGQWVIGNKRQTVYAKVELSLRDRIAAARRLRAAPNER